MLLNKLVHFLLQDRILCINYTGGCTNIPLPNLKTGKYTRMTTLDKIFIGDELVHTRRFSCEEFVEHGGPKTINRFYDWKIMDDEDPLQSKVDIAGTIFNDHIKNAWCDGSMELHRYVMAWITTVIQKPGFMTRTALVVNEDQGTGKGIIHHILGQVVGETYIKCYK